MEAFINKPIRFVIRHPNIVVLLLIIILTIAFFWNSLVLGGTLMGLDFTNYFYSGRLFYRESVLDGDFPLWCPYPQGGVFYAANSGNSCFYPLTALNFVFSPTYALSLIAALHNIVYTFFIYLLVRECKGSFAAGLFAALAAFISGHVLSLLDLPDLGGGLAWYPAVILCFLRLLRKPVIGNVVWLALACSVQVLAGSPYPPFYSMISMAVICPFYLVACRPSLHEVTKRAGATLAAGAAAFCLCSVQLVPTLAVLQGVRKFGRESIFPKEFSMRIVDWLPAVIPESMGHEETLKCFYIGLLPLMTIVLALLAIILNKYDKRPGCDNDRRVAVKMIAMFSGLACMGFLLASGGYLHVEELLNKIPVIGRGARWMSLMGSISAASLAVLAGLAFDMLMETRIKGRRRWLGVAACVFLIAGLALLLFRNDAAKLLESVRTGYWRWIHSPYFRSETLNLLHYPANNVILKFSIFLTAGSLALLLSIFTKLRQGILLALFAICLLADKANFYSTRSISSTSDIDIYNQKPPIVEFLQKKEPPGTLYRVYVPSLLVHAGLLAWNSRKKEDYLFLRSYLTAAVGMQYHIETNNGLLSFAEGGMQYVWGPWIDSLSGETKDRVLGQWNVKYMIDFNINEKRQLQFGIRENSFYQPRAWLSYAKYPMPTLQDCLALTQNPTFKARETALTVEPELEKKQLSGTPGTRNIDSITYTNNTVMITATAERDGYLCTSDTYESGWRAYLDGKATEVYRANQNGRAIAFPAGTHTVLFKYSPLSFWIGLCISILAWLAICSLLWGIYYKHRMSSAISP